MPEVVVETTEEETVAETGADTDSSADTSDDTTGDQTGETGDVVVVDNTEENTEDSKRRKRDAGDYTSGDLIVKEVTEEENLTLACYVSYNDYFITADNIISDSMIIPLWFYHYTPL